MLYTIIFTYIILITNTIIFIIHFIPICIILITSIFIITSIIIFIFNFHFLRFNILHFNEIQLRSSSIVLLPLHLHSSFIIIISPSITNPTLISSMIIRISSSMIIPFIISIILSFSITTPFISRSLMITVLTMLFVCINNSCNYLSVIRFSNCFISNNNISFVLIVVTYVTTWCIRVFAM